MLHTFLPGPASIQDKRAYISMDFFEFSRQTGETFKFYPVFTASLASAATGSPASSSAMHDSGYGSSFNVSPVVSSMSPWTPSLSASTPASTASDARTKSHSGPGQRTTPTGSRKQMDFSNHPGMRILTKDGRDITNSASRGCKSKEQRDHAHLMRIIKACDACRRKKIRCDPSHKKRASSQAQPSRPKKTKTATRASPSRNFSLATPSSLDFVPSFETEVTPADSFEGLNQNPDDFWQQFVHFDDQIVSFPGEHEFFADPAGYVTSSDGSASASPTQSFLPSTSGLPDNYSVPPDLVSQATVVPYLNPGDSFGTNYQDFDLYSPTSELLDEEPQFVRKPRRKGHTSQRDNVLESSLQQAIPGTPDVVDYAYLYSGHNRQHGDLLETSVTDWSHADAGYSANGMHETIPTITYPGTNALAAVGGQPRTQPSLSLSSSQRRSGASPDGLDQVPPPNKGVQSAVIAISAEYATASTPSVEQDSASASIDRRLLCSRLIDISSPLPAVSQIGRTRGGTPLPGLPQGGRVPLAQTARDPSSAVQSEVMKERANEGAFAPAPQHATYLSLRHGLLARSALVLEPSDYGNVVARDRPASLLLTGSVSLESAGNKGVADKTVGAGLRNAPLGVPSEEYRSPFPGTALPALNNLVTVGLVSCLLALVMRWASLDCRLELLFALAFSVSYYRGAQHGRSMDGLRSAAAKPAGLLRRSIGGTRIRCLIAL